MSNLTFDMKCVRANPQAGICEMDAGGGGSNVPPDTFFSLPLSIPAIAGTLLGVGSSFNLGGSPVYQLTMMNNSLTLTNVYAPPVAGLKLLVPLREFSGMIGSVDISINGVSTVYPLPASTTTSLSIPLSGFTNPMTIIITNLTTSFIGGFDLVIYAP